MEHIADSPKALEWVQQDTIQEGVQKVGTEITARLMAFVGERARKTIRDEEEFYLRMQKYNVVLDQPLIRRFNVVLTHDLKLQLETMEERNNLWEGRFTSQLMRVFTYQPLGAAIPLPTMAALNEAIDHAEDPEIKIEKKAEQKAMMQAIWNVTAGQLARYAEICKQASDGSLTMLADEVTFLGEYSEVDSLISRLFGWSVLPHYRRAVQLGETFACSSVEYVPGMILRKRTDNVLRRGALRFSVGFQVPAGSENRLAALRGLGG